MMDPRECTSCFKKNIECKISYNPSVCWLGPWQVMLLLLLLLIIIIIITITIIIIRRRTRRRTRRRISIQLHENLPTNISFTLFIFWMG